MRLDDRIEVLLQLREYLMSESDSLLPIKALAQSRNPWFTQEFIDFSIANIVDSFLEKENLKKWVDSYNQPSSQHRVGMILAGNIPLVGWHDVLSCFVMGHISVIKFSSKDEVLIPHFLDKMNEFDTRCATYFEQVEKLTNMTAVIATGSNNSSNYFEHYFSKYPHIIRKNRNAVGVLQGNEEPSDFLAFGKDIFTYFGLGCRNVSKVYVPRGYNFDSFLEVLHDEYKQLILHHKYKNNYDYNYAIFLMNGAHFYMNGCLLLKEDKQISSRISSLHFEYYDAVDELVEILNKQSDQIQCIVSKEEIDGVERLPFGEAQTPRLDQYADGVDTMQFLSTL